MESCLSYMVSNYARVLFQEMCVIAWKLICRVSEMIQDRQKSPWLWPEFIYNHTPQGKEYKKSLKVLHGFTRSVIEDRIKIGLKCDGGKTKKKRLAFLDMLLNVATEGNLSLDDVQEEVDTFMFEGTA